jgi:hypothetical protein
MYRWADFDKSDCLEAEAYMNNPFISSPYAFGKDRKSIHSDGHGILSDAKNSNYAPPTEALRWMENLYA